MYFKINKRLNSIKVDDRFARLINILKNGDLEFEFSYSINQLDAIKQGALSVNVSVSSRNTRVKPLLEGSHDGFFDTKKLINNVLLQTQMAKSARLEHDNNVVANKKSDITAKINNEIVTQVKRGAKKSEIQQLTKSKIVSVQSSEFKQTNDTKPLFYAYAHTAIGDLSTIVTSSMDVNAKSIAHELILKHGIDPTTITDLTHRSVPASDMFGGTLRVKKSNESDFSKIAQLLNHHLFTGQESFTKKTLNDVNDGTLVHVLKPVTQEDVEVKVKVVIPNSRRVVAENTISHFIVKFELMNSSTGVSMDFVTKQLDVAEHIRLFYTPKKAPVVNVVRSEISTTSTIEIKQVDKGATGVRIYKKTISTSVVGADDYVFVGEFSLTHDQQPLLLQVDKPLQSSLIYRVIPIGVSETLGSEFMNVIVRPARTTLQKAISISTYVLDTGIRIDVNNIPTSVIAVEILRRDLTIHESDYSDVSEMLLIDDATRVSDHVSSVDVNVTGGHVYEYVTRLVYIDGVQKISGNATIEYVTPNPGKVDIKIENLNVVHLDDGPNVTFNVSSTLIDSDIDVVLALLKKQGIKEFFNDDVLKQRDSLKSLIAHSVQRVDLTTGAREDFGVLLTNLFDDKELRKNNAASGLEYGHRYRYEISTLLRTPETLFSEFTKTKKDAVTKKTYTFNPAKFFHPIVLNEGNIVSTQGLKSRYAKSELVHGAIGTTESIDVTFDQDATKVANASVTRFNNNLNVITWKVNGSIDRVDHFLIMKEVVGVRTMVGKAHSEFDSGNCQFIHQVTNRDIGELKYAIIPVLDDYKIGDVTYTNSLVVE